MTNFILDGRSLDQKLEEAKGLLREHGFVVHGPLLSRNDVSTPTQLVKYFYNVLACYRPDSVTISVGSPMRDLAVAKGLIAARIETGCSRKRAIAESCEIIDLLFKHEERLGFSQPIYTMSVLGQGNMGWVTERLLQIRERLDRAIEKEEDALFFQQLYEWQENNINKEDLKEARDRLDKVLDRHGKKEETSND
jgi:hypothetical protein